MLTGIPGFHGRRTHAFSILELIVTVLVLTVMSAFYLQAAARAKARARQVRCLSNLRQVGLAFQMFAQLHDTQYPMNVPIRKGGSKEYVPTTNAYRHFQVLSNTLEMPRILICPDDRLRSSAENWGNLNNEQISYFVGLDASPGRSCDFLSGDQNDTNRIMTYGIALRTTANNAAGWTRSAHGEVGNVLFADGRAEQLDNLKLNDALKMHGRRKLP